MYLASLRLGPSTILRIAKTAEIKRTTAYTVVDALIARGLMRKELKGWKNLFVAEDPEKLESIVEYQRETIKKLLPDFQAIYNLKESGAMIKYYEGVDAIKSLYNELLKKIKPHEDYCIVGELEQWLELDEEFFLKFTERRAKLNINIRILMQESETGKLHKERERQYNEKIFFLPKETQLSTNLVIIPEMVVIQQLTPIPLAIVIENASIIKMHKELFEIIWKSMTNKQADKTN